MFGNIQKNKCDIKNPKRIKRINVGIKSIKKCYIKCYLFIFFSFSSTFISTNLFISLLHFSYIPVKD